MMGPEETERGASHGRLGQQEGDQGRKGESAAVAGAEGLEHRGIR